jgi:hypothetical protein
MTTKGKLTKFLQEIRGYEQITNRRPTPRPAVLYLMALRAQKTPGNVSRQRIAVTTDWKDMNVSVPVKIVNLDAEPADLPVIVF